MKKTSLLDELRQNPSINSIFRELGAQNIRVFGSVARGEETSASDIDFLVDHKDKIPEMAKLKMGVANGELEKLLKREVHIHIERFLRRAIRQQIRGETVVF